MASFFFPDYLCNRKRKQPMHNNKLDQKLLSQSDGIENIDEEMRLRMYAKTYADCEGCIAVMNNFRTKSSHIYIGYDGEMLGFGSAGSYQYVETLYEEEVFSRIPEEDMAIRHLEELSFYHTMSAPSYASAGYPCIMSTNIRMADGKGILHQVLHRIRYFGSKDRRGICYALCIYCLATDIRPHARIIDTRSGEEQIIEVTAMRSLLTGREKAILNHIQQGLASKEIAELMEISKHTVDRHRQNIIEKLQVANTTEAIFKARKLGLI